jgi:Periplasmic component of the Tol biopolymer transport system
MTRILTVNWFHDRRSVLLTGTNDRGQYGVFQMDLADASLKPLRVGRGKEDPRSLTFSPDGKRIVFLTGGYPDLLINELDPTRGTDSVVRRIKAADGIPVGLAFSPDGQSVAVALRDYEHSGRDRVIVSPITAGTEREAYRLPQSERLSGLAGAGLVWTADGRTLIFGVGSSGGEGRITEVRRLSLEDGTVAPTGLKQVGLRGLRLSPDGRTLLYGVDNLSMEMWAMEPPVFGPSPAGATAHK